MSDARHELRLLVERFGPRVLEDAEELRSLLDDVLEEDSSPAETNLLVDAVRYGAVDKLRSLIEHGAGHAAVTSAGGFLAARRGATDERSAVWACEVMGHALGILPDQPEDQLTSDTAPVAGLPDAGVTTTRRLVGEDTAPQEWSSVEERRPQVSRGRRWWPLVVTASLATVALAIAATTLTTLGGEEPTTGGTPQSASTTERPSKAAPPTTKRTPKAAPPTAKKTPKAVPPLPFKSAALYEFARYLFDAKDCRVPAPEEFPFSEKVPDKQLVKCESSDTTYTGTFWCHANIKDLLADRELYVGVAKAGTEPVRRPPAGRGDPVDGIQVAYNRAGQVGGARVYWDSPAQLCAGELQTENTDVDATIDYWIAGRDG